MTDAKAAVARLREALERASEGLQFRKDANAKLGAICYGLLPGVLDELERLQKHAKPSDLDRAQALLRRWRKVSSEGSKTGNEASILELVVSEESHQWEIYLSWDDGFLFQEDPDLLAAIRAAIAQTPWPVTEEQVDEAE